MARLMERIDTGTVEERFDHDVRADDDAASHGHLAAGRSVYVKHADTPDGHVVRVDPDGSEHLLTVDDETVAVVIGR